MKRLAVLLFSAITLSGCAALDVATSAVDIYQSARTVTTGYHSVSMLKDLKSTNPVFTGYDSAVVLAEIQPREKALTLPDVFASNMAEYTASVAQSVRAPLKVCKAVADCSGKVLVVQFKEDAYDRNLVQRLTIGDKIRGKLIFIDQASGRIIDEKRAEMGDNYGSLAKVTSGYIMLSMYKSYPPASNAEGNRIGKELEKTPIVFPQYEGVLGKVS